MVAMLKASQNHQLQQSVILLIAAAVLPVMLWFGIAIEYCVLAGWVIGCRLLGPTVPWASVSVAGGPAMLPPRQAVFLRLVSGCPVIVSSEAGAIAIWMDVGSR